MSLKYDYYNREERALCSHLFRLLHENINEKNKGPLGAFLHYLNSRSLKFRNGTPNLNKLEFKNPSIFCEVSIIRDAYQNRKPNVTSLMDKITRLVMQQESISDCRLFSELPPELNDYQKTHPKQIRRKAINNKILLTEGENKVYGAIQGMFNAKPDLVIIIDNLLLVCEAKMTQKFDKHQVCRTWNISQVWAEIFYKDLGFDNPPIYSVFKLGAKSYNPDISWTICNEIAKNQYNRNDRTRIAIQAGLDLLIREGLE
jgi:hypothetical protein